MVYVRDLGLWHKDKLIQSFVDCGRRMYKVKISHKETITVGMNDIEFIPE